MGNPFKCRELERFPSKEARREAEATVDKRTWYFVRLTRITLLIVFFLAVALCYRWAPQLLPRDLLTTFFLRQGVAIAVFCLALLIASLLTRRRRAQELRKLLCEQGIPICIHCGYDLRGQTDPRCPECGRAFDPRLLRTTGEDCEEP